MHVFSLLSSSSFHCNPYAGGWSHDPSTTILCQKCRCCLWQPCPVNSQVLSPQMPKFGLCGLPKHLAVIWWFHLFTRSIAEIWQLKEVTSQILHGFCADFLQLEMKYLSFQQDVLIICHRHITDKCFGKPQTKIWAIVNWTLGNYPCHSLGSAIFGVILAFLGVSSKKNGAYRDISQIILKHTQ